MTSETIEKSKEYIYNYVDRVRLSEGAFPDYKCPSRGSGWRQNKSVSHLDLATSCHSAASGLNHWSSSHQSRHQLRHSRSLDYNHIDRCKDALDIAEYYWRLDHDPEVYDEEEEDEEVAIEPEQLKYVSEHHLTQHYRDFKCADENYHHSANNIYQSAPPKHNHQQQQLQQQQQQQQQQTSRQSSASATLQHQPPATNGAIPPQAFDFGSDSCSLRRSRSLAVIREETFSDLQISSSNGSRRSQLIPRARLVNRGYFRERDRLICSNNKHHHHHHASREKLTNCSVGGSISGSISAGAGSSAPSIEADEQSNESIAETCDSHQQQLQHYKQQQQHQHQLQPKSHNQQQQQQQQHLHYHPLYHEAAQQTLTSPASTAAAAAATNDYYDHLKRLDKLALGLVAEQLHPWHNDKSDLESLNSDYFKNSLHQSHELKQHSEIEALEQAVNLLAHDKPRIYQSRRQKPHGVDNGHKLTQSAGASGGESCPENSQSSVFPETTTSNSDDQSDSGSLSEQEYDITKIEEIYQKTHIEGDDESYEIISLTTTTRTRFETTEDEADDGGGLDLRRLDECDYGEDDHNDEYYTEESNLHTTTDTEVESTLKRSRAVSENLQKIIAYDSVYLSSEESSDSTLVETDHGDTSLEVTSLRTCIDEVETLLHISIEDSIYEPKAKQHKIEIQTEDIHQPISFIETINTKIEILEEDSCDDLEPEDTTPIYTQILKVEHTPPSVTPHPSVVATTAAGVTSSAASKPKILSVVEKRKLKRYTDSAYSSNVSDSSDKAHGNYPSTETYAFANHQKRQVAEPLYIPLKSNLSDNQYHSLPDVHIGQSLKVFESIDAQLRSSYNLDNYRSLDDSSVVVDSQLDDSADAAGALSHTSPTHAPENHYNSNGSSSRTKRPVETVTSEQIYDSIKRFGRAHQRYRQREIKECQNQQKQQQQLSEPLPEQTNYIDDPSAECDKEANNHFTQPEKQDETYTTLEPNTRTQPDEYNSQEVCANHIEPPIDNSLDDRSARVLDQYDSFEKSKEAPAITVENFSQQIERRAKEIQQSGRRNKQQQIEFAHRAKFRLESTLASYSETDETKEYTYQSKRTPTAAPFRIVVTDAQNNIIEEDSIESQDRQPNRTEDEDEEKENHNFANLQSGGSDLLIIKYNNKERFKDRATAPLNSSHRQSSLRRAPSKPKRQQYPATCSHPHLSSAETKKLVLSPKTRERRVLSNQIYRARPVKVITATDSFRRNKVKQASSKMSRPQILQVIDNKRKSQGNVANSGSAGASGANANHSEGSQVENEYLKKVDAVRCYWSKLANDEDVEDHQRQSQPTDMAEGEPEENTPVPEPECPLPTPDVKELMPKQSNDMENTPPSILQQQQQQQHQNLPEKRQFILGAQSADAKTVTKLAATPVAADTRTPDDYCSFMPSIEIVELDGDKTATIVSAMPPNATADDTLDASEPQFDHIRYKVLKSQQLLRSNVLARNKKEAQFDGLIQYLQDYSFQELLSNNNVVIVEPVRTKIERPSSSPYINQHYQQQHPARGWTPCAVNNSPQANTAGNEDVRRKQRKYSTSSSTTGGCGGSGGGGIKRHFFYQPVRVNRELYEEELPNPDTVRNVRKFFEEHILPTPGQGLLTTAMTTTTTMTSSTTETATTTSTTTTMATLTKAKNKNNINISAKQTSPKSRRTRKYRYLTIDTSYGHAATTTITPSKHHDHQPQLEQPQTKNKNAQQSRKWDTASLSSGVSSGDLSSPCECNEAETTSERKATNQSNGPAVEVPEERATLQGVHVQDMVKKHNKTTVNQRSTRTSGTGIPVRSSSVRPRNAIYGSSTYASLHNKSGKSNVYRNVYEYHAQQGHLHHDSDDQAAADDGDDDDDDDDDLFGDVDDDENELCDTYYVSNDVLRKIRECGSSVTYYGGRVVQTSATNNSASPAKTFESQYNNGPMAHSHAATMALQHQPTMLSQTQTRARVREIETCSSAACQPANECLHSSNLNNNNNNRLLQQKKIHLTKSDNKQNNKPLSTATTKPPQHPSAPMSQEQQTTNHSNCMEGGGITFKLVKSNSCSSRLELAGTDALVDEDPEDTEVVRKMVHHFETSTTNSQRADGSDAPLTINNQTPISPDGQKVTEWPPEDGVKTVTVNNHINVGDSSRTCTTREALKPANETKEDNDDKDGVEEPQTFHTEAKDIHLDYSRGGGGGGGSGNESTLSAKVCRNKNVDLAFTLVKQQQQQPKAPGIKDQETGKNHQLTNIANPKTLSTHNSMAAHDTKCVTYENTLLPTMTATATVNDTHQMPAGNSKVAGNEIPGKKDVMPAQIIVPIEIHRGAEQQHSSATHKGGEERCFLPLSTTSSVTSVIDKSVVKHYVANDKSIYEKRKYDDIEFEEFEIYDPTKEFEKLIEEEEAKRAACSHSPTTDDTLQDGQQSTTSTTSSMRTAKSQQTNVSTETETDCYDSLDDKL